MIFFQAEKICSYGRVFLGVLCCYFENRFYLPLLSLDCTSAFQFGGVKRVGHDNCEIRHYMHF